MEQINISIHYQQVIAYIFKLQKVQKVLSFPLSLFNLHHAFRDKIAEMNIWHTKKYVPQWLTGIRISSFSDPSRPVILTLNFLDQIPDNGPLESATYWSKTSGVNTSTTSSCGVWVFCSLSTWTLYSLLLPE